MSWTCEKCGSQYLREEDAQKCFGLEVEIPLIEVGKILIDESYDLRNEVKCYAIKNANHKLIYLFEWVNPDSGNWEHAWPIHSNKLLMKWFGDQLR